MNTLFAYDIVHDSYWVIDRESGNKVMLPWQLTHEINQLLKGELRAQNINAPRTKKVQDSES